MSGKLYYNIHTHTYTHLHTRVRVEYIILFWLPHELPFTDDTDTFSGRSIHMAQTHTHTLHTHLRIHTFAYVLLCVSIVPHTFNLNNGISRRVKSPENIRSRNTHIVDLEMSSLWRRRHLHDRTVYFFFRSKLVYDPERNCIHVCAPQQM